MTVLTMPDQLADAPPISPERPEVRDIVRQVAVSLVTACVVPGTVFYTCLVLADVWVAIVAALVWSYGAITWRAVTGRRMSGLLVLTAAVMTGRTAIAFAADSTFLYFLQPIISDGLVATAFLLSLATTRPVVARIAADFYPVDHELSLRPRIRRLFWRLTLMWALLCAGKASMTLWLLTSQSMETFVLTKTVVVVSANVAAATVTIWAAAVVARKEGLLTSVGAMPAAAPA